MDAADSNLVDRLRARDADAYVGLFDRYADDMYGVAYSLLGNRADAEDAVQEAMTGAFQQIDAFEGRSSLKTWLFRILFNQATKARRSRRLRLTSSLDADDTAAGRRSQAESPAAAVQAKADVSTMLAALSPEHREVMVLREISQLTYDEMSGVLGVPIGTIESRLYRARQELRRRFEGYFS